MDQKCIRSRLAALAVLGGQISYDFYLHWSSKRRLAGFDWLTSLTCWHCSPGKNTAPVSCRTFAESAAVTVGKGSEVVIQSIKAALRGNTVHPNITTKMDAVVSEDEESLNFSEMLIWDNWTESLQLIRDTQPRKFTKLDQQSLRVWDDLYARLWVTWPLSCTKCCFTPIRDICRWWRWEDDD